jgi:hypothetical protein
VVGGASDGAESVRSVFTIVDVADSRSLEIARAHGLVELGVRTESRLNLQGLDDATVGAAVDRVLSRGIEIVAWGGGADESAWEHLYQDLVPLFGDTPDGQQGRELPSLEFCGGSSPTHGRCSWGPEATVTLGPRW